MDHVRPEGENEAARIADRGDAMTFDVEALYVALDKRRRQRNISARELLRQAGFGNSASIWTRIGHGQSLSADALVKLLAWLGETDLKPYMTEEQP